ncbi:MAG: metallophosphoesterase family protein [Acidimicrobiia bacterium]
MASEGLSRRRFLGMLGASALAVSGACRSSTRPAAGTVTTTTTTAAGISPSSSSTSTTVGPATTTVPPAAATTATTSHPVTAGFVAFGDAGGGPAQGAVAEAMHRWAQARRVDALVTTGDNVYDFGEPRFFAAQLDDPYRRLRDGGRPLWATLGNHDVVNGHGPAQLAHLGLPALPYARQLPGVRILFLDSGAAVTPQARWLDAELARPGPPAVVVFHAPIRSCGLHGPFRPLVEQWTPIIEGHRVPLVLNGHDHLYNRFVSPAGTTYVVTGGGGRPLYAHRAGCGGAGLAASAVRHHFVGVEVSGTRMTLTAVTPDGVVIDQAEIPFGVAAPA